MKKIDKNIFYCKNDLIDNNTFVILLKEQAVVIDPSWNYEKVHELLLFSKIQKIDIMLTHGHYDHVGDISLFKEHYDVSVWISRHEDYLLLNSDQKRPFSIGLDIYAEEIKYFEDYKQLEIENSIFKFLNTPGHSVGSTCIFFKNYIFTGDFLFAECLGRTDLISSSMGQMIDSVKKFDSQVDSEKHILPGHGDFAKMKEIRQNNVGYNELLK